MIRVLCDCRMADWSGVGRYSTGLVRALAASGEVELVQAVRPDVSPPVPDAETLTVAGSPFGLASARALASAARAARPDVTHCLHFPTPMPAPHPLVVTLHDLTPIVMPEVMPSALRRAVYRWWNRRAAGVADRVVVPSEHTAGDVRRLFPRSAASLRLVPEAADDFAAGPVGELPAVARERPYVLSMANTKANKDLPTLLRAFARVSRGRPELALLLVGRDAPGYTASVLAGDPSAARVRFTEPVPDDELRALYSHAEAFVFPSRYEGFGLPVLEAMALGAPVVLSDASSLPEVAGDAALTFPAGDPAALAAALDAVLGDPGERDRLREAGRERAASFSWEETARRTIAVYRELLA